ncbi:MAG: tRNA (guanosine(46)-N7)-methyltransferase TrmB [Arenimonas sp.]
MQIDADNIGNSATEDLRKRRIRSFVLRQGRVTLAQKRAFTEQWPHYGIEYNGEQKNFDAVFSRQAELVLEIGFGNGEQMHFAAVNELQRDFIGVEVHGPGVGRLLNAVADDNLNNVRIYQHDAVEVLKNEIADAALSQVRIYFPDPWHKKRHHKRRMIQTDFVKLLCQKIKPGGLLHLATDWENYAEHMWDVCDAEPLLTNHNGARGFATRPEWRRQTHFETRGLKLGHGVWDLLYTRR